ncbi:hypothetical protein MAPG_03354 [Magnaporthiopsis poae ATCC 64411]|uniref:Uncharacterized protein n=1 Tax=Magnaporthiopsis poae (strain ATCC 64411 / 73-15) TaxID=644358 RepID=A0A0C4DTT0_MAGP6|nr:hypothetical protein MAPG_03354 [Magnaporthiopsis poae ATCC 64411]
MDQQAPPRAKPHAGCTTRVVTVDGQGTAGGRRRRLSQKKILSVMNKFRAACFFSLLRLQGGQISQQRRLSLVFRDFAGQTACERDERPGGVRAGGALNVLVCVGMGEFILAETGSNKGPWIRMEPPKMRRNVGHSNA